MNIAPTDFSAAARSGTTGRQSGIGAGRGLVRAFICAMLAGVAVASVPLSAAAAGWPSGDRDSRDQRDQRDRPQQQQQQPAPPPQREMPPQRDPRQVDGRQYDSRPFDTRAYDTRLEEARRQQAQQQQDSGRRGGRLTPDERRELRRQINEAGMDLYPNTPRR